MRFSLILLICFAELHVKKMLVMQAAETHLVNLFEDSMHCAVHAKRVTLSKFIQRKYVFVFLDSK